MGSNNMKILLLVLLIVTLLYANKGKKKPTPSKPSKPTTSKPKPGGAHCDLECFKKDSRGRCTPKPGRDEEKCKGKKSNDSSSANVIGSMKQIGIVIVSIMMISTIFYQ